MAVVWWPRSLQYGGTCVPSTITALWANNQFVGHRNCVPLSLTTGSIHELDWFPGLSITSTINILPFVNLVRELLYPHLAELWLRQRRKAKAYNTQAYVAPKAAYSAAAGALLCHIQSGRTAYRPPSKTTPTDSDLQTATCSPGLTVLMVSTLVVRVTLLQEVQLICRPWRDRKLSWPGWQTHSGQFIHKVVTREP